MKRFMRIGALVLAIMMITMVGAAYAADGTNNTNDDTGSLNNETDPNTAIKTVSSNTFTLNKTLIMFNPETVGVYEPSIQYTYNVTTVTVNTGATVTDDGSLNNGTPVTYQVKSGVAGGLTCTSATAFSNSNKVTGVNPAGTLVEKTITLTTDPTVFSAAGIYRYKLTDTTNVDDLNAVGITRPTGYKVDRYIDLYVKNDGNNANGTPKFKIDNAVVFTTEYVTDPTTDDINTTTLKTTGYNESSQTDDNYTDDTNADHYYTYNLKVEKETTGSMADRSHQFPFSVAISDIKAEKITYAGVGVAANSATDETVTSNAISKGELTENSALKLKDGESVTFYGIPYGAKATVNEYNDTYDEYKAVAATTKTTYASTEVKLPSNVTLTSKTATAKAELANILIDANIAHNANDATQSSAHTTLAHFTNNLAEISPTGYVSRFAPYALILVGGIVLLIIAMKRKGHKEEE